MDQIIFNRIPNISQEEFIVGKNVTKELTDEQLNAFLSFYLSKRKAPDTVLLTCLLGLVVVAGVHRFLLGQVGMGILWLLTGGLCLVGTIVDAVNYKNLALDYNQQAAFETLHMVKAM